MKSLVAICLAASVLWLTIFGIFGTTFQALVCAACLLGLWLALGAGENKP
jgi:hypothetical protein